MGSAGKGSEGDEGHAKEGEWTLTSSPGRWTGGSPKEDKVGCGEGREIGFCESWNACFQRKVKEVHAARK